MQIAAYERTWVDGLNRGDVSVADKVFAPNCVIHINGSPERNLGVDGFKQMVSGLLAAFPDLHFTVEDQIVAAIKSRHDGSQQAPTAPLSAVSPQPGVRCESTA